MLSTCHSQSLQRYQSTPGSRKDKQSIVQCFCSVTESADFDGARSVCFQLGMLCP